MKNISTCFARTFELLNTLTQKNKKLTQYTYVQRGSRAVTPHLSRGVVATCTTILICLSGRPGWPCTLTSSEGIVMLPTPFVEWEGRVATPYLFKGNGREATSICSVEWPHEHIHMFNWDATRAPQLVKREWFHNHSYLFK
jgi:hypothetical protein